MNTCVRWMPWIVVGLWTLRVFCPPNTIYILDLITLVSICAVYELRWKIDHAEP